MTLVAIFHSHYNEGGVQGVDETEIEPEVYSIFQKLENVK